jgi:excisionase family DNA binding protein
MQNRAHGKEIPMTADTDNLIAMNDVAAVLGVCRATVYNFLIRGMLCGVKVGSSTKVKRSELQRFLETLPAAEFRREAQA